MKYKRAIAVAAALSVPAAPAVALAATGTTDTTTTTKTSQQEPKASAAAVAHVATHRKAVKRNVRLARLHAKRTEHRLSRSYDERANVRSLAELQKSNRRLRLKLDRLKHQDAIVASLRPTLRAIANCESHHNPHAVNPTGTYRGLFQFDHHTWSTVGGKGDPARASVREQYLRAALLYKRVGRSPWPVCGR